MPETALITAGTTGSGLAIALRIARPGVTIFLDYIENDVVARQAADQVAARGAEVVLVKEDIGSLEACRRIAEKIEAHSGKLNWIVHSAAVPNPGDLIDQNLDEVQRALEVGGMALLYLVRATSKLLVEDSAVLYLSGVTASLAIYHHGAIGMAKAVGECMVRYLAIECSSRRINFNTLRFGPIDSPLFRTAYGGRQAPAVTPYGRALQWDDVTNVAAFLLSREAVMIRGQTIMVDGGLSSTVRKSK